MENLTNIFGKKFHNNKYEEVLPENSIFKVNLIGILFTGSWCPPCELFEKELINVYNEANSKEKIFEIVQVSNEKSEKEYKNCINETKPWLFFPFNDPQVNILINEYKITFLPVLLIVNKDRYVLSDTGRKDVSDLGVKAYEKWYKLYRVQKEREKDMLINI
jgi:nucleoredoxin